MRFWISRVWPTLSAGERITGIGLVAGLVAYAALALLAQRWLSGLVAPVIAVLLAIRHPRARFSAYVFFSALALRALVIGAWPLLAFGGAGVLVLQTPAARRMWPRLHAGSTRSTSGAASSTSSGSCSKMGGR